MQGDARQLPLPDNYVQCVVTSPPYFGLRDYGLEPQVWGGDGTCRDAGNHEWGDPTKPRVQRSAVNVANSPKQQRNKGSVAGGGEGAFCLSCGAWRGTLGNEPTPDLYIRHLVEVFREVRRVLRDDGVVWLNLGDSFVASPRGNKPGEFSTSSLTNPDRQDSVARGRKTFTGLKQKDLIGIPWLAAFALRADGWYLRADIIWAKGVSFCPTYAGSSMPESVTDRPSRTHEYVFLLTKHAKYFYDVEAVRETATTADRKGERRSYPAGSASSMMVNGEHHAMTGSFAGLPFSGRRNLRSVWTINPKPYPGAHFATFPSSLVEPCIKAGTSEGGCCPACGASYRRIIEKGAPNQTQQRASGANADGTYTGKQAGHGRRHAGFNERYFTKVDYEDAGAQDPGATKASILAGMVERRTVGWAPTCGCDPVPPEDRAQSIVLDPFSGSGTVATTAVQLGQIGIGVERKWEYLQLAQERVV